MVLLSFFAVFFSADQEKRDSLILQIVSEIRTPQSIEGVSAGAGKGPGQSAGKGDGENASLSDQLEAVLHGQKIQVEKSENAVVVHFPDDVYGVGDVNLSANSAAALTSILQKLLPYKDKVVVGFIGHADSIPVMQKTHKQMVSNNFDISVIRASKAMVIGQKLGMSADHMYASGSGENIRRSRSLSVIVKLSAGGLL